MHFKTWNQKMTIPVNWRFCFKKWKEYTISPSYRKKEEERRRKRKRKKRSRMGETYINKVRNEQRVTKTLHRYTKNYQELLEITMIPQIETDRMSLTEWILAYSNDLSSFEFWWSVSLKELIHFLYTIIFRGVEFFTKLKFFSFAINEFSLMTAFSLLMSLTFAFLHFKFIAFPIF